MSDRTSIEWTDATWNPVTGCDEVSPGCDHCYAKTLAERFRGTPGHYFENGFDVQLRPERLTQPLRWKKPRRIFVNSMSDLFHKDVPDEFIAKVFAVMGGAEQHTFQVLTKRHGRMRSLLSSNDFRCLVFDEWFQLRSQGLVPKGGPLVLNYWPTRNVWLGVSVENQQWANTRIPALLDTPAAVRFLSCEPLLGPVSLFANSAIDRGPGIDWVIAGGESGHGARPMRPSWVRGLRDECHDAGIPFLFKQWGEWAPQFAGSGHPHHTWLDGIRNPTVWRVGKKTAGRELDGRTHDEFPEAS